MTAIKICNQTVTPKWLQTKKETLIYQASYFINQCGRWEVYLFMKSAVKSTLCGTPYFVNYIKWGKNGASGSYCAAFR